MMKPFPITLSNTQEAASAASSQYVLAKSEIAPRLKPEAAIGIAFPHTVAEWQKNSREAFRVSLPEYKGKALVDCRVFYLADDDTMRPSPKGISAALIHLPALAKGIADALDFARRAGLVEGGEQ
jgi:Transcriptional Coactivator p15 (PC4)